jgi:outer membrane protein TolC
MGTEDLGLERKAGTLPDQLDNGLAGDPPASNGGRRVLALVAATLLLLGSPLGQVRADDGEPAPVRPPPPVVEDVVPADPQVGDMPDMPSNGAPLDVAVPSDTALALSLQEALQLALRSNLDLEAGRYNAPIAYQRYRAADAAFDTLLTANLDVSRNETPSTFSFTGSGEIVEDGLNASYGFQRRLRRGGSIAYLLRADRLDSSSPVAAVNPAYQPRASVEMTRPLLRGAGDVALSDLRRAQNGVEAACAGFEADVEALLLRVVEAYWELVYADVLIDAREKSLQVATELLDDANSRMEAEVGTPLDVAEARAGVERRRSEVLQAQSARGTIEDRLLALMMPFGTERMNGTRLHPTDGLAALPASRPSLSQTEQYVRMAWQGRPELRGTRADIASRGVDVHEAYDAIRPQLDLRGSVGATGLDSAPFRSIEDVITGRAISASIGIQFSMFVGQRAARSNWRAAAWARRQAQLRHRELQNQIVVQVRGALREFDTASAQLMAGEAEVQAAEEGAQGERDKLEQGKSTPFLVLQREDDLTGARTRVGRAKTDLRLAEARLWRSLGQLGQNLGVKSPRLPLAGGR